tara:strand:+ start:102 stop:344 length:243 start_codon:yes stop_codon:yes gene_type:complete
MSSSFSSYELSKEKKKYNQEIIQDEMFDFMCDMSQNMRDENIPIVNNLCRDFPGFVTRDQIRNKKENDKKEEIRLKNIEQ